MVKRSLDFDKPVKHPKPVDARKLEVLKESLAVLEQIAEAHADYCVAEKPLATDRVEQKRLANLKESLAVLEQLAALCAS